MHQGNLTVETLIEGRWHRAALLEFTEPDTGSAGACAFEYDFDYLSAWIGKEVPLAAVSLRPPVEFGPHMGRRWPSFLDDIRPLGSGRRWWLRRLNLSDETASELQVLRRGTIAPIGNLRIQEAVPSKQGPAPRFKRRTVIERQQEFLSYAAEVGAQVGGATGAVRLAPVFDFAPMKMDLEGITRTTRWRGFEAGDTVDWSALLKSFGGDEPFLREGLRELALRLKDLPELLSTLGLPAETLSFETLGLPDTETWPGCAPRNGKRCSTSLPRWLPRASSTCATRLACCARRSLGWTERPSPTS